MIIKGKAYWAKIVGDPQPGYDKTQKEWSIDLSIDEATKALLKKEGVGSKVKNSDDVRGDYITFKRKAIRQDGEPAKPIRVVGLGPDKKGLWDKTLIGNGSEVNVSFVINEGTYNLKPYKKPSIIAVQVVNLVPYEGKDDGFDSYTGEDGAENWDNA